MTAKQVSAALVVLETIIQSFERLKAKRGETAETDAERARFQGAKWMLEELEGGAAKGQVLTELRKRGNRIPHTGSALRRDI